MIPALIDVDCPFCGAGPLEPCTSMPGRYMEFSVHGARRIRADVDLKPEPTPRDMTKCKSGKHDWIAENIRTYADGRHRCGPCAADNQRIRNGNAKRKTAQTKRPRKNVQHRNGGTHCRNGHEYTPENTYMNVNGRNCRQCKRDRENRAYAKKRESK